MSAPIELWSYDELLERCQDYLDWFSPNGHSRKLPRYTEPTEKEKGELVELYKGLYTAYKQYAAHQWYNKPGMEYVGMNVKK